MAGEGHGLPVTHYTRSNITTLSPGHFLVSLVTAHGRSLLQSYRLGTEGDALSLDSLYSYSALVKVSPRLVF